MTTFQKIVKYFAIALAVALIVSIVGGILGALGIIGGIKSVGDGVLKETKTYPVHSQIHTLDIRVNAAALTIVSGDSFSVESNLSDLQVTEQDGKLTIRDEKKWFADYTNPVLTVYIPADAVFDRVSIFTGAGKLTADSISTDVLELELGAGDVQIGNLNAYTRAEIEGGAGKVSIGGGTLHNLELEMGVGKLQLAAALLGNSALHFGVGESDLTLLGSESDYQIELEKGIGNVTVDGKPVNDYGTSGTNRVEIEGGIGAIHLNFKAS